MTFFCDIPYRMAKGKIYDIAMLLENVLSYKEMCKDNNIISMAHFECAVKRQLYYLKFACLCAFPILLKRKQHI